MAALVVLLPGMAANASCAGTSILLQRRVWYPVSGSVVMVQPSSIQPMAEVSNTASFAVYGRVIS